jgi:hypothetical protein
LLLIVENLPVNLSVAETPHNAGIGLSRKSLLPDMTTAKKSAPAINRCWPGFEPVPGKSPRQKGSCKPIPGKHSKATKRATQRAAAASKLEKQGKPNPRRKPA